MKGEAPVVGHFFFTSASSLSKQMDTENEVTAAVNSPAMAILNLQLLSDVKHRRSILQHSPEYALEHPCRYSRPTAVPTTRKPPPRGSASQKNSGRPFTELSCPTTWNSAARCGLNYQKTIIKEYRPKDHHKLVQFHRAQLVLSRESLLRFPRVWRRGTPISQAFTFAAKRKEHKDSFKDLESGEMLTNISVFESPPRHGCTNHSQTTSQY